MAAFMAATSATVAQDVRPVIVDVQDLRFASEIGEDGPYDAGVGSEQLLVFLHDGMLDFFDVGQPASSALAAFAAEGITSGILQLAGEHGSVAQSHMLLPARVAARFDGTNGLVGWGPPPPIFDPSKHRYMSFLAKLYPSDDAFVGNDDPRQYEIFDDSGKFVGPMVLDVWGGDVLDAGVKANEEQDLMWLDRSGLTPNEGWQRTEEDVVRTHPGFNGSVANPDATPVRVLAGATYFEPVPDSPRVLRHMRFDPALTDFKRPGSSLFRLKITSGIHQGWAGSYFNPALAGEGAFLEVIDGGEAGLLLSLSFYTYEPDGSGDQVYVVGAGPIQYDLALVDLYRTTGGRFASPDNPAQVERPYWGKVSVLLNSPQCEVVGMQVLETADPAWALDVPYILYRSGPLPPGAKMFCGGLIAPTSID